MALLLACVNFADWVAGSLALPLPIYSSLLSIWLVRRYNNRRAISVVCAFAATYTVGGNRRATIFYKGFRTVPDLFSLLFYTSLLPLQA